MGNRPKQKKKQRNTAAAAPVAALYNLDAGTERGDAVRAVLDACGIRAKTLAAEHLAGPVGAAVGMHGFKPSAKPFAGEAPTCEFMLLYQVPNKLLDKLLEALRAADAQVACKAVVTASNRLWPLGVLIAQIESEHAALSGE